jgi:hypothetical protein
MGGCADLVAIASADADFLRNWPRSSKFQRQFNNARYLAKWMPATERARAKLGNFCAETLVLRGSKAHSRRLLESFGAMLDHASVEVARNEHQARMSVISGGPFLKQPWLVENMLHAVDHQGPILSGEIQ